ncbi:unnamed protein product [Amoebophrya sp. A25]|nr:unnamed protein product [Amoebophrya sp. A25]|eukprot:GSA25T00020312001.1
MSDAKELGEAIDETVRILGNDANGPQIAADNNDAAARGARLTLEDVQKRSPDKPQSMQGPDGKMGKGLHMIRTGLLDNAVRVALQETVDMADMTLVLTSPGRKAIAIHVASGWPLRPILTSFPTTGSQMLVQIHGRTQKVTTTYNESWNQIVKIMGTITELSDGGCWRLFFDRVMSCGNNTAAEGDIDRLWEEYIMDRPFPKGMLLGDSVAGHTPERGPLGYTNTRRSEGWEGSKRDAGADKRGRGRTRDRRRSDDRNSGRSSSSGGDSSGDEAKRFLSERYDRFKQKHAEKRESQPQFKAASKSSSSSSAQKGRHDRAAKASGANSRGNSSRKASTRGRSSGDKQSGNNGTKRPQENDGNKRPKGDKNDGKSRQRSRTADGKRGAGRSRSRNRSRKTDGTRNSDKGASRNERESRKQKKSTEKPSTTNPTNTAHDKRSKPSRDDRKRGSDGTRRRSAGSPGGKREHKTTDKTKQKRTASSKDDPRQEHADKNPKRSRREKASSRGRDKATRNASGAQAPGQGSKSKKANNTEKQSGAPASRSASASARKGHDANPDKPRRTRSKGDAKSRADHARDDTAEKEHDGRSRSKGHSKEARDGGSKHKTTDKTRGKDKGVQEVSEDDLSQSDSSDRSESTGSLGDDPQADPNFGDDQSTYRDEDGLSSRSQSGDDDAHDDGDGDSRSNSSQTRSSDSENDDDVSTSDSEEFSRECGRDSRSRGEGRDEAGS